MKRREERRPRASCFWVPSPQLRKAGVVVSDCCTLIPPSRTWPGMQAWVHQRKRQGIGPA